MKKNELTTILCACGCRRRLKKKFVDLHYKLAFVCHYDKVHGKDAYSKRRTHRQHLRYKRKHRL